MLDPMLPLELDDGRPVVLSKYRMPNELEERGIITVRFSGSHERDPNAHVFGERNWLYYADNGEWIADPLNRKFRLRNVDETVVEEDWS